MPNDTDAPSRSRSTYVLFYFISSRAPYGVYSSMWRIKHEWTERPARGVNGTGSLFLSRGEGTGERRAQRKPRAHVIATAMRKDSQVGMQRMYAYIYTEHTRTRARTHGGHNAQCGHSQGPVIG